MQGRAGPSPENDDSLGYLLKAVRGRLHVVLPVALGCMGVALGLAHMQPKRYKATARLLIESSGSRFIRALPEGGATTPYFIQQYEMATRSLEMRSRPVAERVARVLNLSKEEGPFRGVEDQAAAVLASTSVESVPDTRFLEISCETFDPKWAADIANAYADAYIYVMLERRRHRLNEATSMYGLRIPEIEEKLNKAQEELFNFTEKHMGVSPEAPQEALREREAQILRQLSQAQQERIEAEAFLVQLTGANGQTRSPQDLARDMAATDAWVRRLFEERLSLGARVLDLRKSFREGHPELETVVAKMSEVDAELRDAAEGFVDRARRTFEAVRWKEEEIMRLLAAHREETGRIRLQIGRYQALRQRRDNLSELRDKLESGQGELDLGASLDFASAIVDERAVPPVGPSRPNRIKYGFVGLLAGIMLGGGLAFLLENLDETVRSPEDIRRVAALSTLGSISRMNRNAGADAKERALVAARQPASIPGEQFRSLRTSILAAAAWNGEERGGLILVTSPELGEGKTTVALNAAGAFAQLGQGVVVVDADLRRPVVHEVMAVPRSPGLVELLEGEADIEDVIRPTSVPNLFIVPAGRKTTRPGELLAGPSARAALERLGKKYGTVWVDSPPVIPVADARNLAPAADVIIMVVRAASTRRRALQRTCDDLGCDGGRTVGVVLNDVPPSLEQRYTYRYHRDCSRSDDAGENPEA